jgi:hypothetical protein
VSAVFPYREQLEVFRKALRKESVNELFNPKELLVPKILGLHVVRYEMVPGKAPVQEVLYTANPKTGRAVVGEKAVETSRLFLQGVYDDAEAQRLAPVVVRGKFGGMVTPLFKLAEPTDHYPKLDKLPELPIKEEIVVAKGPAGMPGFPPGKGSGGPGGFKPPTPGKGNLPPGVGPKMPNLPGLPGLKKEKAGDTTEAVSAKLDDVVYTKLAAALKDHFARTFGVSPRRPLHIFDPSGAPPSQTLGAGGRYGWPGAFPGVPGAEGEKKQPKKDEGDEGDEGPDTEMKTPVVPGLPGSLNPQAGQPGGVPEKCLVRFFDADVQPGKTYVYAVQVRIENPNHGKPDVVAYKELADVKELPAPWTFTAPVSVPGEWDFYVVDQKVWEPGAKWYPAKGAETKLADRNEVAVQIYKWFDEFEDQTVSRPVGDWLVLERALLHRGEPVNRTSAMAPVPVWNKAADHFQLTVLDPVKGKKLGVKGLNFSPPQGEPPVVVDFTGGYKVEYPFAKTWLTDTAAVELLLLGDDGKLFLRNGRSDGDKDAERGHQRWVRYTHWHQRLEELLPHQPGPPSKQGPGPKGGLPGR